MGDIETVRVHCRPPAGFEARHQTASAALIDARRTVAIAWRNWQRAQAADYIDRVYVPALDQFVAAIRGVTAAATALGHNRLNAIARHTVLCDPADPERNPANPRRSGWQTDPVSGPLYQRLRDLAATVRRISKASRTPPSSRSRPMPRSFDERLRASFDPLQGRRLLDQIETGVRPAASTSN